MIVIRERDLGFAVEALLICAVNATTPGGLKLMYRMDPLQAKKHLLGLLAALSPLSGPDAAIEEGVVHMWTKDGVPKSCP